MSHQLWIINYDSFEGTCILPLSLDIPSRSAESFPFLFDWFGSARTSSRSGSCRSSVRDESELKLCSVTGVRGLICSRELRLIRSNSSNLDVIEHGRESRDSCEYSDRQLSSFPRVWTEREPFKTFDVGFKEFDKFDFSVLIEHWLDRTDLISVKLAQEVITSGIAKLQRPIEYIFIEYIQQFLPVFDPVSTSKRSFRSKKFKLTKWIFDDTRCR